MAGSPSCDGTVSAELPKPAKLRIISQPSDPKSLVVSGFPLESGSLVRK
jgi:hypothetical protein